MKTRLLARLACISLSIVVLSFASFQADASAPKAPIQKEMFVWRVLLLVYPNIDVEYNDSNGTPRHLSHTMPEQEISDGTWAFRQFASIANDFSNTETIVDYTILYISRPINSLTSIGNNSYWVSPIDTRTELDQYAPQGTYDSIFVFWNQTNFATGQQIPSPGWGLGMGPSSWSNGSTYATVANAESWAWSVPTVGEPWLHEWLHGVCSFYASKGYQMPAGDADGGSGHGYPFSSTNGWAAYYRDLMTGHVLENGTYKGITPDAWQSGSILAERTHAFADYFYDDTTASYQTTGTSAWVNVPAKEQYIQIGTSAAADNKMYHSANLQKRLTATARLYIPANGAGNWDSLSVALKGNQVEYWATLAYGAALIEKNHISILHNGDWGELYPLSLSPGWYTTKFMVDYQAQLLRMKAWADGVNEPDWQVSRALDPGWIATEVGFRHFGQGTRVDDLFVEEDPGLISNDDFSAPTVISNTPFNTTQSTLQATAASDDPHFVCVNQQKFATVWFKFVPPTSGTLSANTIGSNYDTVLGVWTGTRGALTSVACDDDAGGNLTSQVANVQLVGGTPYYIEVAAFSDGSSQNRKADAPELALAGGTLQIGVSFTNAPVIPPKPTLLSPPNGNQSRARSRVLDWTDSTGATRYEVQIRQASKTGPIVASDSRTISNYKTPKLNRNYWYWWRVRACATSDPTSCSRWTKPWQYKVLP